MIKNRVYGTSLDGTHRYIVAAPSMKQAHVLLGCTYGHIRTYGAETRNETELAIAHANPGTVFIRRLDNRDNFVEWKP